MKSSAPPPPPPPLQFLLFILKVRCSIYIHDVYVSVIALGARCSSVVIAFDHGVWVIGMILHGIPIELFHIQSVFHDWCNKGCDMSYPLCGMMHIKESLLHIGKSSPCGGSGFLLSLSESSFTICLTPYSRNKMC